MALLSSELVRLKYELGYHLLAIGAEPYIGYVQQFDQVVLPYLNAGASTTSSTAVTAASAPTPVALTLADASGFVAGARVVIDVDTRQEIVTAQALSGAALTVQLSLAHSGTYPVTVEGGESIVRSILRKIAAVHDQFAAAANTAGLKRVDVIEWHGNSKSTTQMGMLGGALMHWRNELASALGVVNLWRLKQSAGQSLSLY